VAAIRRVPGGAEVELEALERRALIGLLVQLDPMIPESTRAGPPAYDDPVLEAEYRRLTGPDLQEAHARDVAAMRRALEEPGPVSRLAASEVDAWLRALAVLRVVLAERIGITADGWEEGLAPDAHRHPPYAALHALGWVQDELLATLQG